MCARVWFGWMELPTNAHSVFVVLFVHISPSYFFVWFVFSLFFFVLLCSSLFLNRKRAQKSAHFKERVIEKVAQLMGLLAVEEEERVRLAEEGDSRADQVDHLARKTGYLQGTQIVSFGSLSFAVLLFWHTLIPLLLFVVFASLPFCCFVVFVVV